MGPTATSRDAQVAIPRPRQCGSVGGDFRRVRCPAIFNPLPRIAVHIEKSPRIGLELANRYWPDHIAATAITRREARPDIGESAVGAECGLVVTKAVHSLCTCSRGIFPLGLGWQAIGLAGPAPEPRHICLRVIPANANHR